MSKTGKDGLLNQLDYWNKECQIYRSRCKFFCKTCFHKNRCEQSYEEIPAIIEQHFNQVEVDEEWIEKWSKYIYDWADGHPNDPDYVPHLEKMLTEAGVKIKE